MRSREEELRKIGLFKPNWYALIACICAEKETSVFQGCKSLGIELKDEKLGKAIKDKTRVTINNKGRAPVQFDLEEVKRLYKELKSVRQVAIKLKAYDVTVKKFMVANDIEIIKKSIVSDSYDMLDVLRLLQKGDDLKQIAQIKGYKYASFYKFMNGNRMKEVG